MNHVFTGILNKYLLLLSICILQANCTSVPLNTNKSHPSVEQLSNEDLLKRTTQNKNRVKVPNLPEYCYGGLGIAQANDTPNKFFLVEIICPCSWNHCARGNTGDKVQVISKNAGGSYINDSRGKPIIYNGVVSQGAIQIPTFRTSTQPSQKETTEDVRTNANRIQYVRKIAYALSAGNYAVTSSIYEDNINRKEEMVSKIKEAAAEVEAHPETALVEFEKRDGKWAWNGTYLFVLDCMTGIIKAHPSPILRGMKLINLKDKATGKEFGTALCDAAKKADGGWVEFMWTKPGI